jgi:predicted NBD/HSP70 family sugar kinase
LRDLLTTGGTKDVNRLNILRRIMARPGPQKYLSLRSGLSEATVSEAVKDLLAAGYIEVEKGGRSNVIKMAPTVGAAVGIELGFRYGAVVARRVEQDYKDAKIVLCPTGAAARDHGWLDDVAHAVRTAVDELGEEEIVAIGLGVPRVVDPHAGVLVPPAMPPWSAGDNPAKMLAERLREGRRPVLVAPTVVLDNDANLVAYAESIYRHEDAENLVAIKASTGIGAGIIIAGRIYRGGGGAAGEIGHVVVNRDGRFCTCGGRGCLETLIGADALVAQAKTVLGGRNLKSPETFEELVVMAGDGNLACQRVLQEAGATLGLAIGNLCNVLNPNVIVLSGAFGRDAAKYTVEPCKAAIRQSAMQAAAIGEPNVTVAGVEHPAAHGALVVALEGTSYDPVPGRSRRVRSA